MARSAVRAFSWQAPGWSMTQKSGRPVPLPTRMSSFVVASEKPVTGAAFLNADTMFIDNPLLLGSVHGAFGHVKSLPVEVAIRHSFSARLLVPEVCAFAS